MKIIEKILRDKPDFIMWDLTEIEYRNEGLNLQLNTSVSNDSYLGLISKYAKLNLDVIRIVYEKILNCETFLVLECVKVAADPAGFIYLMNGSGEIFSFDHDGGAINKVAFNFDDFINNYIFGIRSDEFLGTDYKLEIMKYLEKSAQL